MEMESLCEEYVNELKLLHERFRIQSKISLKSKSEDTSSLQDAGDNHTKNENLVEKSYGLIFSKLDEILSKMEINSEGYKKVLAMKASLYYETAKTLLNSNTVEKSKAFLENGLDMIQEYKEEPQTAFLYMRIVNYLSYVLSILGDLNRARTLLETSITDDFKFIPVVYTTEELFLNKTVNQNNAKLKVTKIIINNMQMLGWIYGRLGLNDLYADIIHKSLQKELDTNEGDPIQWAMKCYKLASLFVTQTKWKNATYLLGAAQSFLDPLEADGSPNSLLFKAQADMARVWVSTSIFYL